MSAPSYRESLPAWDSMERLLGAFHCRRDPGWLGNRRWLHTFLSSPWLDAAEMPRCCAAFPHLRRGTYHDPAVRWHPGTAVMASMADSCLLGHNHGTRGKAVQVHIALSHPRDGGSRDRWGSPPRSWTDGPPVFPLTKDRRSLDGLFRGVHERSEDGSRSGLKGKRFPFRTGIECGFEPGPNRVRVRLGSIRHNGFTTKRCGSHRVVARDASLLPRAKLQLSSVC